MRLLQNLSIGAKLTLSAGAALALLLALAWSAQNGIARLASLQRHQDQAATTEGQIKDALIATADMRALSQTLLTAQSTGEVTKAIKQAEKVAVRARAILVRVNSSEHVPTERAATVAATGGLDRFLAAVREVAARRKALILLRGRRLIAARTAFEDSVNSFASELAHGGMEVGGVAAVEGSTGATIAPDVLARAQAAFAAYRLAMSRMQNAALLFLATGNLGAANAVHDGIAAADQTMKELLGSGIPDQTASDAHMVGVLGKGIEQAAATVVDQTIHLDDFVTGTVAKTSREMSAPLERVAAALTQRADAARQAATQAAAATKRQVLAITGGIVALLLVSATLTARAIARPIRAMTEAMQAIAAGEPAPAIAYAGRRDEIGRMAAALTTLREAVRDAFVRAEMVRQFPIAVMMTEPDGDFRINYMNPEAEHMTGLLAEHLAVPPDQILGKSIDMFHRDPEHQRAVLGDPSKLPLRARVKVGDETFELSVCAIRDRHGTYVGPMMSWTRVTARVRLVAQFEHSVGAIAQDVGTQAAAMKETAAAMSGTAAEAGALSTAVSGASDAAAANVSAVAASAEELAASVAEISRQVGESAAIAGQAVREAEATDQCVTGLAEAAGRIGDVVRLIGDIAGRTNLLALNATIEAARAGEAGKGFAVVASEVKTLATQTARATEEIGSQITAMQSATGQAVEALRSIGATIQKLNEIAATIAGAVEEQGAATQEIARAVQEAASGTASVTGNITRMSGSVEHTSAQAGTVLDAASELARQSEVLKGEVAGFIQAIEEAA